MEAQKAWPHIILKVREAEFTLSEQLQPLIRSAEDQFTDEELQSSEEVLRALSNEDRIDFRNANAAALAQHDAPKMLIVAGPGAGKSFLFMDRIRSWLAKHPEGSIRVASFVRKLVGDLRADVEKLTPDEVKRVEVSTLHRLARSLLERNGGTSGVPLDQYIRIISDPWQEVVWEDAMSIENIGGLSWDDVTAQFHDDDPIQDAPWPQARENYFRICRFYNAVSFADSIVLARHAVEENAELVDCDLWIFDEFQDFNKAEERLILTLTSAASGVLLAGDDDQALYQTLKASHPEIIRGYYNSDTYAKGLLPYCSRCDYHITLAAEAFLKEKQDGSSIKKIFLPLRVDEASERVRVIGCANPTTVASYIEAFISDHRTEIEERKEGLENGTEKDPYLLILSFSRNLAYLGPKPQERIEAAVAEWRSDDPSPGPDFFRALLYSRCARVPTDNFSLRKVLYYEGVPDDVVHGLIREALASNGFLEEGKATEVTETLARCRLVLKILEDDAKGAEEKAQALAELIAAEDVDRLAMDLAAHPIGEGGGLPKEDDEEVFTPKSLSAVEVLSMAGSKGLSAEHVIVVGCDQLNMRRASVQLFFVAMTRARKSLHLITSLKAKGATKMHRFIGNLPEQHCQVLHGDTEGSERTKGVTSSWPAG